MIHNTFVFPRASSWGSTNNSRTTNTCLMPQHADNIYEADQRDDLTPARNTKQELPCWPIFLFVSQDTNNSRFGGKPPSWIYFSLPWFPLNSNLKSQGDINMKIVIGAHCGHVPSVPEPIGPWPTTSQFFPLGFVFNLKMWDWGDSNMEVVVPHCRRPPNYRQGNRMDFQ